MEQDIEDKSGDQQQAIIQSSIEIGESKNERFELLILSEAGKPIYSYTKRDDAVTLMPLCSALIEYANKAQKETMNSIKSSDGLVLHFYSRSPLIIIVIHEDYSFVDAQMIVEQVEAQVISILTAKTLTSVFQERPTFDLKRLLYGSEKLIDATTNLCAYPRVMSLPGIKAFIAVSSHLSTLHRVLVPTRIIPPGVRDNIHNIMHNVITSTSKNMVFSLLFDISGSTTKLITVCNHHDRHKLKIADIHIILALLSGSSAQLSTVESLWMPICLPKFNQDAYLHSYIAHMNDAKHCIALMSIDRDEFESCQKCKNAIEQKLDALKDLDHSHKRQEKFQNELQFFWYQTNKQVFCWRRSTSKVMSPVIYYVTKKMSQSSLKHLWLKISDETVYLGWHVPSFKLYAQFDSDITKNEATEVIQRITNWIKTEEDNFSIKDYT